MPAPGLRESSLLIRAERLEAQTCSAPGRKAAAARQYSRIFWSPCFPSPRLVVMRIIPGSVYLSESEMGTRLANIGFSMSESLADSVYLSESERNGNETRSQFPTTSHPLDSSSASVRTAVAACIS